MDKEKFKEERKKDLEKLKDVRKKSKGLLDEFKTFIKRGNVLDLAVGVVIGSSFGSIVTSLVDNILMPVIGALTGGKDINESLCFTIGSANIKLGSFIQSIIDFLIIAFCIFIFVKVINGFLDKVKKEEKKVEEKVEPKKSDETVLLEEIRDLLKKRK